MRTVWGIEREKPRERDAEECYSCRLSTRPESSACGKGRAGALLPLAATLSGGSGAARKCFHLCILQHSAQTGNTELHLSECTEEHLGVREALPPYPELLQDAVKLGLRKRNSASMVTAEQYSVLTPAGLHWVFCK